MTPTVGRVVWYNPAADENINRVPGQPLAAMIACVNEDGTINLGLLDRDGVVCHRVNVHLLGPDADAGVDETKAFACWMPDQIGQAQKTEQLQAAEGLEIASDIEGQK